MCRICIYAEFSVVYVPNYRQADDARQVKLAMLGKTEEKGKRRFARWVSGFVTEAVRDNL